MPVITGYSIATLVVFCLSAIFVIHPVTLSVRNLLRIRINLTTAPITAIAILWASQCLGPSVIRDGITGTDGIKPYNILILFFSLAYMAITLDITGILQAAAFWVSNKGGSNGWKLYLYFYLLLTVCSIFLGNDPVILSGTAFLVYYARVSELNPISWLISEFATANTASMVLFVGNPTNVVICEGFDINSAAFSAYTILPFLACNVVCFLALGCQFRRREHIPRTLYTPADLDVRSVLLDPIGAVVGSLLLGSCLTVIIVVSFFKIDAWMISLPFAISKLAFDFIWDHYRFVHKISMSDRYGPSRQSLTPSLRQIEMVPVSDFQHTSHNPQSLSRRTETCTAQSKTVTAVEESAEAPAPDVGGHSSRRLSMARIRSKLTRAWSHFSSQFHTFSTALPRLPFALIPFAFSQFILVESLSHQGWINVFAGWFAQAARGKMYATVWLVGILGILLCNISGTNIGATILLTKVIRSANLPTPTFRAAAIALAVTSNIGAVSFTFSASLAGLLWSAILRQKGITVKQRTFARWNSLPLAMMTVAGLAVVSAEMSVVS